MKQRAWGFQGPLWTRVPQGSTEYRAYSEALGRLDRAPTVLDLEDCIGEVENALEGIKLSLSLQKGFR